MWRLSFLFCHITFSFFLFGQNHLKAKPIQSKITIDGELNEPEWTSAEVATDFTQSSPKAGEKSAQQTEVKLLYDNNSIYVSAIMYDVSKDSIYETLSTRDDYGNADYFGVVIDTYGSSTIGFAYGVTSAGVQVDELNSPSGADRNWNAVWESAVKVEGNKWIAELEIPFSALRFPNKAEQTWRINFFRGIRRLREDSYWNEYDPKGFNFLSQLGYLDNVSGVEAPLRLSLIPYVSAYAENQSNQTNYSVNGGMDIKYGINDAFTLDMTLIPDFGQVQFDKKVLNLSPYEVKYNERRQFFTEGVELFNKGDLFYSRRVGSPYINYDYQTQANEVFFSQSTTPSLLNASKLSGRTKKGLGIGVFNGLTSGSQAVVIDTITQEKRNVQTSPLTNYNVLVLDQNLKNNSTITAVNTSVWRAGKTYDANVSAFLYDLYNKTGSYNLSGNGMVSQKYGDQNEFGYKGNVSVRKSSGKFQANLNYDLADDKYDPNDLGYLRRNNYKDAYLGLYYNTFKPFWRIYRTWSSLEFNHVMLFNPNVYNVAGVYGNTGALFKNYLSAGVNAGYTHQTHDYFEARIPGRVFVLPASVNAGFFISSNYAKKFALDINISKAQFFSNRHSTNYYVSPRFRFSDKFSMIYEWSNTQSKNERGLALFNSGGTFPLVDNNPVFGERNRQTIENTIQSNFIFTNRMGISLVLRHYWSKVNYKHFYTLNTDGSLTKITYNGLSGDAKSVHNNSFNAFTIDMAYRWVFKRGSELSLVWKNAVFSSSDLVGQNYFTNSEYLLTQPFTNSLSLKLLYYIDYNKVANKLFKAA
ncbi:MAG: DUF5916 domain-containing protein [Putridiphycobacter sp.]